MHVYSYKILKRYAKELVKGIITGKSDSSKRSIMRSCFAAGKLPQKIVEYLDAGYPAWKVLQTAHK